jgi:adenosine deaminase
VEPGLRSYLADLPKIELHCHLLGTFRPATAAALARDNGISLPVPPEELYPRIESAPLLGPQYLGTAVPLPTEASSEAGPAPIGLLEASRWLAGTLVTPGDFARVAYEAQVDAQRQSNVVHRELFFEVGWFLELGVPYRTMVDGLIEGLAAAQAEVGISGTLIAGIDRQISAGAARELVEAVVAEPRAQVVGIGLEGSELLGPPGRFADAYRLAAASGLRRTAHAGEHAPTAAYVLDCLDVLGCDRIDHGYFVLEDPAAVRRCATDGVAFSAAFTTSRKSWIPWRRASVRRMVDAGLAVNLGSDDPAMFPTTLAAEYLQAFEQLGLDPGRITAMMAAAIDASWLPDEAKAAQRSRLAADAATLAARHGIPPAH